MKLLLSSLLAIIIYVSCGSEQKQSLPKERKGKIAAVLIKRDSTRPLVIMWLEVVKSVKYDSIKNMDVISVDSIWVPPVTVPVIDSTTGRAKFDAAGKPIPNPNPQYFYENRWNNDSVIWDIAGKDFDSLTRKQ